MARDDYLFCRADWFAVEARQVDELKLEVTNYDGNCLLNSSIEDLCDYFETKYRIQVPELRKDAIVADQQETHIDVSHDLNRVILDRSRPFHIAGTTVEITIPLVGDSGVFSIRPTSFNFNPPRALVRDGLLVIQITGTDLSATQVRAEVDRTIAEIESYLTDLRANAEALNSRLRSIAKGAIEARRQKLLQNQNLVSSLGFAIRERKDAPRTYVAPEVRRKLSPTPPPASAAPYRPEPSLSEADYDHILEVIQNTAQVIERSPCAFASMDEDTLRWQFLVQLNGHYEGQATGETFNCHGKTDILIRSGGRNIFIAECKFWAGPKKLTETIDQLLNYSSWRDTKVAILVFNRNKDFTNVLHAIQETVPLHTNCKRVLGPRSETVFRYIFSHRDDANREMTLSVLAFDMLSG